ncbi:hypothetical protein BKA56DRAFT_620606 [Ilyonectria sp. MPI-CAGE-AT-0026]|nr:hypothetical protein BKA56DRAFT_620606 [Ilyonectria sp. MPI-CAGE-AT-0026]
MESNLLEKLQTFKSKPRVFILTDMLNEPDDSESFVRYLLYSNEFDTRGIVATTSVWLRDRTHPEEIEKIVKAYGTVVDKLNKHGHPNHQYQQPEYFLSLIASGPKVYGKQAFDQPLSEGARLLLQCLAESSDVLYLPVWGGPNTLAQALKHMGETMSSEEAAELRSRLRVYTISDQDDTAPWIRTNFPDLTYITSIHAPNIYELATWRGISAQYAPGSNDAIVSNNWLEENIQVGPLGAVYPTPKFIMEGDTPSFLWLIQNGLNDPNHIEWGGWGGRYGRVSDSLDGNLFTDSTDRVFGLDGKAYISNQATIWRWREDFQNDFAARMQWTLTEDFAAVSHPPVVKINGEPGPEALLVTAQTGGTLRYDASETYDPDHPGDISHLDFQWFQYWDPSIHYTIPTPLPESGGLMIASLSPPEGTTGVLDQNKQGFRNVALGPKVEVTFPSESKWGRLHLILQVTNTSGKYPIARYRRLVFQLLGESLGGEV